MGGWTRDEPDWLIDFSEERHKETLDLFKHYIELLELDKSQHPDVDEEQRFVNVVCADENCPVDVNRCQDITICYFYSVWMSYHYCKYRFPDRNTISCCKEE